MNMRHNELFLDNNNDFTVRSKDCIGRYSMWFDHSDVKFTDVYGKQNFEFKPHRILFLVPLLKTDLFFMRTENSNGIISEQFMYCSVSEKIQKKNFWRWLAELAISSVIRSFSSWIFICSLVFGNYLLFPLLGTFAIPFYFINRKYVKRYVTLVFHYD